MDSIEISALIRDPLGPLWFLKKFRLLMCQVTSPGFWKQSKSCGVRLDYNINLARTWSIGRHLFSFHPRKITRSLKIALIFLKNNSICGSISGGIDKDNKANSVVQGKGVEWGAVVGAEAWRNGCLRRQWTYGITEEARKRSKKLIQAPDLFQGGKTVDRWQNIRNVGLR